MIELENESLVERITAINERATSQKVRRERKRERSSSAGSVKSLRLSYALKEKKSLGRKEGE